MMLAQHTHTHTQHTHTHTAFYNLKMKYDESDNLVIRASRVVTDRVGDAFSGVMTQSDMAEALAEILKIDPSFSKEEFVRQCQFEIIPTILEVKDSLFLNSDSGVLIATLLLLAGLHERRCRGLEGLVS